MNNIVFYLDDITSIISNIIDDEYDSYYNNPYIIG